MKLVVQMIDPETNSLLLLYDDAQSLYGAGKRLGFSFSQVGVQARGRTTILRLNYRNTAEVLELAYNFAREVLTPAEAEEDGIPLVAPESAGRHGPKPVIVKLPDFGSEVGFAVKRLRELHDSGIAWNDMAVLYRMKFMGERLSAALEQAGIPIEWLGKSQAHRRYNPTLDSVKIMTMHASKGLEFPVVLLPGIGYLPHAQGGCRGRGAAALCGDDAGDGPADPHAPPEFAVRASAQGRVQTRGVRVGGSDRSVIL